MDAKTKVCCLIGRPVEHSLSPLIHNMLAEEMKINMVYTAFNVEEDNVGKAVAGANALGIAGLNVTVPHKCAVIPELVEIDELAEKIGAVNTLVPVPGGYKGYNTDIIGLGRELDEAKITIEGEKIIIIGAGGASNAITYLCANRGAKRIWLINRSVDRARRLADEVNSYFPGIVVPISPADYGNIPMGKYPVIQTTSAGLYPQVDNAAIMDEDFYQRVSAGVDIIFNPSETLFMKKCREHGAAVYNGLKMLLYQGIAAFELWNKVKVPQQLADKVLVRLEKELGI